MNTITQIEKKHGVTICPKCKGTGEVPYEYEGGVCFKCNGDGIHGDPEAVKAAENDMANQARTPKNRLKLAMSFIESLVKSGEKDRGSLNLYQRDFKEEMYNTKKQRGKNGKYGKMKSFPQTVQDWGYSWQFWKSLLSDYSRGFFQTGEKIFILSDDICHLSPGQAESQDIYDMEIEYYNEYREKREVYTYQGRVNIEALEERPDEDRIRIRVRLEPGYCKLKRK